MVHSHLFLAVVLLVAHIETDEGEDGRECRQRVVWMAEEPWLDGAELNPRSVNLDGVCTWRRGWL